MVSNRDRAGARPTARSTARTGHADSRGVFKQVTYLSTDFPQFESFAIHSLSLVAPVTLFPSEALRLEVANGEAFQPAQAFLGVIQLSVSFQELLYSKLQLITTHLELLHFFATRGPRPSLSLLEVLPHPKESHHNATLSTLRKV